MQTNYCEMNIIHAGGKIDEYEYSNSYESIMLHIRENTSKIFEVDVVKIKDSYVIAHDDVEKKFYNYDGKFSDLSFSNYKKLKVFGRYTPMDFEMLNEILNEYPEHRFILDIKGVGAEYISTLEYIKNICGAHIDKLIPQVYCREDFDGCINSGYRHCLIALWKKYGDVFSKGSYDLFTYVTAKESMIDIFGISMWYKNYLNPNYEIFKQKVKYPVYFHGQTWNPHLLDENAMLAHNQNGIYFFKGSLPVPSEN